MLIEPGRMGDHPPAYGNPDEGTAVRGSPGEGGTNAPVLRVLIISTIPLLRDALTQVLKMRSGFTVVSALGLDGLERQSADLRPDVILLDSDLCDSDFVSRLRDRFPDACSVAVVLEEGDARIFGCAQAGVHGFVSYDATVDELAATLEHVFRGELPCSPRLTSLLFRHVGGLANFEPTRNARSALLTNREAETVSLIGEGLSNKQIARRLAIRVSTVKNHVHHILQKLGVPKRSAAAARMREAPGVGTPRRQRSKI
jgi:two-component system, NarL family, nitrate/nitrite response regulator NarL